MKQEAAGLVGYLASSIVSLLTAHVFRVIEGLALLSRPVARSISIDFSQLSACRALFVASLVHNYATLSADSRTHPPNFYCPTSSFLQVLDGKVVIYANILRVPEREETRARPTNAVLVVQTEDETCSQAGSCNGPIHCLLSVNQKATQLKESFDGRY